MSTSSSLRRAEFGDGGSEAGPRAGDCDNLRSSGSWAVTKVGLRRGRDCEVRCCMGFGKVNGELLLVLSTGREVRERWGLRGLDDNFAVH